MYGFYVDNERFRGWFDNPQGDFTIGNLPSHIKELLETKADYLIFSPETLAKQKKHHPEITVNAYVGLLNKVMGCEEIYQTRDHHIGLIVAEKKPWAVIIKSTKDKLESYLVSLHRLDEHSLKQIQKLPRLY
jgi:hypothetical protein